jgi:hypothetical protein
MPPKTQREREAEQRQNKLDRIKEQVDEGSLVIRKMTDQEREQYATQRRERTDESGPKRRRRTPARKTRPLPPVSKG